MAVRFTGGEPLLREDFQTLYIAARRLGLRVFLFTNGRLITSELTHAQARYLGMIEENEKAWEVTDWKERVKKFTEKGREKFQSRDNLSLNLLICLYDRIYIHN